MGLISEVQDLKFTIKRNVDAEAKKLQEQKRNTLTAERKKEIEIELYNNFNNELNWANNKQIYNSFEEAEKYILSLDARNEAVQKIAKIYKDKGKYLNYEERYYIDVIYEKIYKKAKSRYTVAQKAEMQYNEMIQKQQQEEEAQKLAEELARQQEEIRIQEEKKAKEERMAVLITKCINIFFLLVNPITIIIYVFIWLFFKVGYPVLYG